MSKTSKITKTSKQLGNNDPLSSLLRKLRFSAQVFFRAQYCGEWGVDTSGGRQVPFHLVSQGEGWLHNTDAEPQKLLAGQLVMFPHDSSHVLSGSKTPPKASRINQQPPTRIVGPSTRLICGYFSFDQTAAKPLLNSLPEVAVLDLSNANTPRLRELVNLWMREAADDQLGSDVAVDRLAEVVFIELLRSEVQNGRLDGAFGALGDPRLGNVINAIHANPGASHIIETMAQHAGMSQSAFAQRFKRIVGMSCGQYVKHWRMLSAARELSETARSMADIASQTGYESEAAFRKAFKQHFDIAPGSYRKNASSTHSITSDT
jgi:AraC family transcriptional activator of mtrCDE